MNIRLLRIAPLLLALSAPVSAQDTTTAPPKLEARKAQGSALVVKTNSREVATGMAEGLEVEGELPEAKEGSHYVVTLDDGGKAKVTVATGAAGYMELAAKPGALMEIFADKIEQVRGMAQGMGTMALSQSGMKPKDAVKLIQAIFDFPKQIDSFELKMPKDPEHAKKDGMDIDMHLTAVAGTGFAEFMSALQPNGQGAPTVASDGLMEMAFSAEGKGLAKACMPFLTMIAPMMAKTDAELKSMLSVSEKMMNLFDGSMAIGFTGDGMQMVAGLTDSKAYTDLIATPEYKAMMKMGTPMAEVEVTEKAFEHRSISVMKTVTKGKDGAELPPNPLFGEGPIESHAAVAENYMLVNVGGKDGAIKSLIDQAVDKKMKRTPLSNNALMTMNMNVAKFAEKMGGSPDEEAPEKMTMSLARTQSGLGLKIHAK